MKQEIIKFTSMLELNSPPPKDELAFFIQNSDFPIDPDYVDFISHYNGASGFLAEDRYILFWKIQEVLKLNPYYEDIEECKNLYFIGSDGGNEGIAFDKKTQKIVTIDFLDIAYEQPNYVANSFLEFLINK